MTLPIADRLAVPTPGVDGLLVSSPLGAGGMGVVFAARDLASGDRLAVKVVATASSPVAVARFEAEVDALAHIRDPHVVALRRTGVSDGVPFAVLARVDGFGLDELRGPVAWPVAVHLGRQLAQAIAAVHRAGYVHRDIKPSNIMVGRRAELTLIDFGLAKPIGAPAEPGARPPRRGVALTLPGVCMGTPRYLAPEVAGGGGATPRSDLHAFGLVMTHLLGTRIDDVPSRLMQLVTSCLEKDPERRPASADELVAVLASLPSRAARLHRRAPEVHPRTGPARRRDRDEATEDTVTRQPIASLPAPARAA